MTIKELINKLNQIENKDLPIKFLVTMAILRLLKILK